MEKMFEKKYIVELDEGVGSDIVIEVILDCIEKSKEQYPNEAKNLQKFQVRQENTIYELAEGISPQLIIIIGYLSPYTILAFKEIVIPLIQKKLKIKEYK